jgi:cysteine desulfurase
MRVYFDNAATTPLDPLVLDHMLPIMKEHHGNPSSIHQHGRIVRSYIEESRKTIAHHLKASIAEIFFTSSATEANNLAIQAAVRDLKVKTIITSPTEHDCVLNSTNYVCECNDIQVHHLSVDDKGHIQLEELEKKIQDAEGPVLVSIMHANNEIGTIADTASISELCEKNEAYFHCDTVQTLGKYHIDVSTQRFSFLSGSGHKFYGPKGIGFIYVNSDNIIKPMIHGGSQERNMRAGTENTYGIAGVGKALDLSVQDMDARAETVSAIRQTFMQKLKGLNDSIKIISPEDGHRHILAVGFPKSSKTDLLKFNLDIAGISASSGSACSSGVESSSHVMTAIGLANDYNPVRFSFSHLNTIEEVDYTVEKLKSMI